MVFKVIIVGYSQMFAAAVNAVIDSGHEIVGVLRNERVKINPFILRIKDYFNAGQDYNYIKNLRLPEIHARSVNSNEFRKEVLKRKADLIIVASWGEKFKKETLMLPPMGCINIHPSLLPKYRGPNPYLQVIKNMEKETGITFHLMDENYDSGAILAQVPVAVLSNDTGKILRTRCANVAKEALVELLDKLNNGVIFPIKQDEKYASYYPHVMEKDVIIDFQRTSEEIDAQLRAIVDWQPCFFAHKNKYFAVKSYRITKNESGRALPGIIVEKNFNKISVTLSADKIIELQNPKLLIPFSEILTPFYIAMNVQIGDVVG